MEGRGRGQWSARVGGIRLRFGAGFVRWSVRGRETLGKSQEAEGRTASSASFAPSSSLDRLSAPNSHCPSSNLSRRSHFRSPPDILPAPPLALYLYPSFLSFLPRHLLMF